MRQGFLTTLYLSVLANRRCDPPSYPGDCARMSGNPEVISAPVGLVTTNVLLVINDRTPDCLLRGNYPETGGRRSRLGLLDESSHRQGLDLVEAEPSRVTLQGENAGRCWRCLGLDEAASARPCGLQFLGPLRAGVSCPFPLSWLRDGATSSETEHLCRWRQPHTMSAAVFPFGRFGSWGGSSPP